MVASLPDPRVDPVIDGRATPVGGGGPLHADQPPLALEPGQRQRDLVPPQARPAPLRNIAIGEWIGELAAAELLGQQPGRAQLAQAVDPPGVRLQEVAPGGGQLRRRQRNRAGLACPSTTSTRWNSRARPASASGTWPGGSRSAGSRPGRAACVLQVAPPRVEELLGVVGEAEERDPPSPSSSASAPRSRGSSASRASEDGDRPGSWPSVSGQRSTFSTRPAGRGRPASWNREIRPSSPPRPGPRRGGSAASGPGWMPPRIETQAARDDDRARGRSGRR